MDLAVHTVIKAYPNSDIRLIDYDETPSKPLFFRVRNLKIHHEVVCHPGNGTIIGFEHNRSSFVTKVLDLHYSFNGGYIGQALVFFIGLFFLTSLITVVIIYRKQISKVLFFRNTNQT